MIYLNNDLLFYSTLNLHYTHPYKNPMKKAEHMLTNFTEGEV